MKRILSLLLAILLVLSVVSGCKKMPAVDKNIKPGEHFSQYDKLTRLYGTPWRQVLEALDIGMEELEADGLTHVGVPIREEYANITFDTVLRFNGKDNSLSRVEYSATYQYPEEEEKLLQDLVKINRELIADFGKPSDTSFLFNWVEKKMGEQWNRDIAYWQDAQILKRLLDEDYDGNLLLWNLSSVAPEHMKELGLDTSLSIYVSVQKEEGTAVITINY